MSYDSWKLDSPPETKGLCTICDLPINTNDYLESACSCIHKVEEWTDEEFVKGYDDLPPHVQEHFKPPLLK